MPKSRKTPRTAALSRRVIPVQGGHRSVRIAVYPKNVDQVTGIIFGLGYGSADTFSKINFEVRPEEWAEIELAVLEAFRVAGVAYKSPVKRPRKSRAKTPPLPGEPPGTDAGTQSVADGAAGFAKGLAGVTGRRQRVAPNPIEP